MKTAEKTTRVLFNWRPRNLGHGLRDRFRRRLMRAGWYTLPTLVQLRDPAMHRIVLDETKVWHKDEADPGIKFVVWSNVRPTQVRLADGSALNTQDGDVILIDNDEVEHRAPSDNAGRWFVRTGMVIQTER